MYSTYHGSGVLHCNLPNRIISDKGRYNQARRQGLNKQSTTLTITLAYRSTTSMVSLAPDESLDPAASSAYGLEH